MKVTILIKGSGIIRVYNGVDLIRDGGNSIHIHGFYKGVTFSSTWCKSEITFIDVLVLP